MWHVTFNNAGNPQNMMLGQFLALLLTVDEEAALRVFDKSTIQVHRRRDGLDERTTMVVTGPTGGMDVVIERTADAHRRANRRTALAKLTPDELRALGIDERGDT